MKSILFVAIAVIVLSSCNDTIYDANDDYQAIGDVFVRVTKTGEDTLYAPVYYTYSNFNMKEVQVTGPTDSNIDESLAEYQSKQSFRKLPVNQDFSSDDLPNGIYQFTITDETQQVFTISDKLLSSRLDPLEITEFSYDQQTHSIQLKWNTITNADVYVVKIYDQIDGQLIYVSQRTTLNSHRVIPDSSGWTDFEKQNGKTYVVGVYAYQFELPTANSGYDINCESVAYRELEW